jgi:hypothetical protein
MAMRMPRLFRADDPTMLTIPEQQATGPRPLREPAPILPWPGTEHVERALEPVVTSRAQIRTRRFPGHTGAEEDRYSAVIETAGMSPSVLLSALARLMESSPEMNEGPNDGSPFVLEVRVVAG